MTPRTIYHVGAFGRKNLGDEAIRIAMHDMFNELAPEYGLDLHWNVIDCQATVFTPEVIEDVNRNADMLLIGGGGLLWDKPELKSPSGWQFQIETEHIDLIEVPIVCYALGWNVFPYNDSLNPMRAFPLLAKAELVSFRNPESAGRAASYPGVNEGAGKGNLVLLMPETDERRVWYIIPDPALFLRADPRKSLAGPRVCLAHDKLHMRYEQARDVIPPTAWPGTLVAHLASEDAGVHHDQAVRLTAAEYRDTPYVASNRKHGIIIPHGQGTPTYPLPGGVDELYWIWDYLHSKSLAEHRADADAFNRKVLEVVA